MIDLNAVLDKHIRNRVFHAVEDKAATINARITQNTGNLQSQISELKEMIEGRIIEAAPMQELKPVRAFRAGDSWGSFEDDSLCKDFNEFLGAMAEKHGRTFGAISARMGKFVADGKIKFEWSGRG